MAADRPACARLLAVAPAGRSAACYTITRDTTIIYNARGLEQRDRIVGRTIHNVLGLEQRGWIIARTIHNVR